MREELELDVLTTVRDRASGAFAELVTRHPRDEVVEAIGELARDGFLVSTSGSDADGPHVDAAGLTRRGEALLHDLEHAD